LASLIDGFEYDIFISYRHNDNRSGWVSDFVEALKEELGSTIKESLTIYFDKNPGDGLLDTHIVNMSLEGKLKSLIFIPIISQTYCDEKGFAWSQEFCVFNKLSSNDQLGRDIRLTNGNVGSRILPVRIHDLDADDKSVIEKEIGSAFRAIEFIYKEPGVNRPLKPADSRHDNKNNTDYRNQINKVANAVKEIASAIKSPKSAHAVQPQPQHLSSGKRGKKSVILVSLLLLVLVAGYFVYASMNNVTGEQADKSVAVLAFADMSPAKDQEWFSDGLSEEILNRLANLRDLKVTARTSSFFYKGKDVPLHEIANALGVAHIVEGSVQRIGDQLRITAQLIRAKDESHIWSQRFDRKADDLFLVQEEIAESIARALIEELSAEDKKSLQGHKPSNIEAYECFIKGLYFHDKLRSSFGEEDFKKAEHQLLKAVSLDPGYADAYAELANVYQSYRFFDRQRLMARSDSLSKIAYRLNPNSFYVVRVKMYCHLYHSSPNVDSAYHFLKALHRINPNDAWARTAAGHFYEAVGLPDLSLKHFNLASDSDPLSVTHLVDKAGLEFRLGMYAAVLNDCQTIRELDPRNPMGYWLPGVIAASHKNIDELQKYFDKVKAVSSANLAAPIYMMESALALLQKKTTVKERVNFSRNANDRYMLYFLVDDKINMIVSLKDAIAEDQSISFLELANNSLFDPLRQDERFKEVLDERRLVDELMRTKYGKLIKSN
jgi:TolB-like protein